MSIRTEQIPPVATPAGTGEGVVALRRFCGDRPSGDEDPTIAVSPAAMRNVTIDHFPSACLCGVALCRGAVSNAPAALRRTPQFGSHEWLNRKAAYGDLVAPYLLLMDDARHAAPGPAAALVP